MRLWRDRPVKAVVFDFDGTLAVLTIDFGLMRRRVLEWMKSYGVGEDRIREKYLLEIIDEVYPLLLKEKDPGEADKFYRGAHQILKEVELEAARGGSLIPGSMEILTFLKQKGMKVGIVTRNCGDAVRTVFPDIDLYCDVFLSRDGTKRVKPHPDHLTSVLTALGASGSEAVMVGDHILDIRAGKEVGMRTIGVLTGYIKREAFEEAGADIILKNVSELLHVLEEES